MEKLIKLAEKADCTGCQACSNSCPRASIKFELDGLHYYPVIDKETCIRCGKCMSVCPPLNWNEIHKSYIPSQSESKQKFFCAWNSDEHERKTATSGGIGSALASLALSKHWNICGAAFDEDFHLSHIVSKEITILSQIKGSKYLQSNTEGLYLQIQKLLNNGEKVLFIGTPCQADALNLYISDSLRGNLLVCEIICHGVNSPKVWLDYKNYLEKIHNSNLSAYNFRSKSKGWGKLRVTYSFNNGKKIDEPAYRNIFHHWFGQHFMLRESCFRCFYRTRKRYSDIIIGDFWGIENIEPLLDVKTGASVVITNSQFGEAFFSECKVYKKEIEPSAALDVIKGFFDKTTEVQKTIEIERMHKFEMDYLIYSFDEMCRKLYPSTTHIQKLFNSILYHLHLKK